MTAESDENIKLEPESGDYHPIDLSNPNNSSFPDWELTPDDREERLEFINQGSIEQKLTHFHNALGQVDNKTLAELRTAAVEKVLEIKESIKEELTPEGLIDYLVLDFQNEVLFLEQGFRALRFDPSSKYWIEEGNFLNTINRVFLLKESLIELTKKSESEIVSLPKTHAYINEHQERAEATLRANEAWQNKNPDSKNDLEKEKAEVLFWTAIEGLLQNIEAS